MDPISLAVAVALPGVHRMPSLEPRLPSGTEQRFKCHQSAAQRFSSTNWMQKGRRRSPKTSHLSLTVLCVPVSKEPDSLCSGCGAPWGVQNGVIQQSTTCWSAHFVKYHQSAAQRFSVLPDWLVVLKNTVKVHFLRRCRRAGNWNVSPKLGVAAGGLAQRAMTQTWACAPEGRTGRLAARATSQTARWGKAALVREPVGVVRNGGACYTGSMSPDHSLKGGVAGEEQVEGAAWGYGEVLG